MTHEQKKKVIFLHKLLLVFCTGTRVIVLQKSRRNWLGALKIVPGLWAGGEGVHKNWEGGKKYFHTKIQISGNTRNQCASKDIPNLHYRSLLFVKEYSA